MKVSVGGVDEDVVIVGHNHHNHYSSSGVIDPINHTTGSSSQSPIAGNDNSSHGNIRRPSLSADNSASMSGSVSDYRRLQPSEHQVEEEVVEASPRLRYKGTNPLVILLVFSAVNTFIYFDRGLFAVMRFVCVRLSEVVEFQ
jgi:hypothetical protein